MEKFLVNRAFFINALTDFIPISINALIVFRYFSINTLTVFVNISIFALIKTPDYGTY